VPGRAPRVTKTPAIVLRQRRLGEADQIVTLLTPHRGKIDIVAKGLLRTRSKMAGHLQPLTLIDVVLAQGRTMDVVTQAQTVDAFGAIRADLDRLSTALYFLELADRFTVEHADTGPLFGLLHAALVRLDRGDGQQLVTRVFELALLEATGFRPEWSTCLGCGEEVSSDAAHWSPVEGGVYCATCAGSRPGVNPIDATVLRVLRAYQQHSYEDAARIRLTDDLALRIEYVMHALMRAIAERELKSASFISAARRARVAAAPAGAGAEASEEGPR
jgi:DNA repair protein RecO (recombination protein O)